jgi:uroporphyrinogen-III decarboxylase
MATEDMTGNERLWAAIRLEKTDRVPIVPTLLAEPAAHLAGITPARVAADNAVALDAILQAFDEYGGWDSIYPGSYTPLQLQASNVNPLKVKIPGRDLPEDYMWQLLEEEILQPQDYDSISEMGIDRFYYENYIRRISDLSLDDVNREIGALFITFERFQAECQKRNVKPFFMGNGIHPFFTLSLMRSIVAFTKDLYYQPEPVERAIKRMTADIIANQIPLAKESGLGTWLLTEERASAYFYPPAIFERFWWPYTKQIIDAFWAEGIVTIFHLDQCWDKNIPYFRQLPRGSFILELDSKTDIFAAKEALRGHGCFHGDVPAALLSVGKPQEVYDYCRMLIDRVGDDGGFILGSGCSVPCNVEPDNFRAMIEAGKSATR